jgi:hypothetical protein
MLPPSGSPFFAILPFIEQQNLYNHLHRMPGADGSEAPQPPKMPRVEEP